MKVRSLTLLCSALLIVWSCSTEETKSSRTYRMGFQNSAPRYEFDLLIQSLQIWSLRADAAMITTEVPWDSLFAGKPVKQYVINNYLGLVNYYRDQGFKLWVYIDPQNGLNRASDANALVAMGKSIADADVQYHYRRFVVVMDSILRPDHLGLALETNLIRAASSASIYNGIKKAVNDVVTEVRAVDSSVKLSISVQADFAWGKLLGDGTYVGIDQDLTDFPFIQELGISSYPYFDFNNPEDLPINYYSKLAEGTSFPIFITEGGWTSTTLDGPVGEIVSNKEKQRRYIARQGKLLDHAKAKAVFQLTFTDIDVDALPDDVDPSIAYFAHLGLMDINFQPKPSLDEWDKIFNRKLKQ